MRKLYLFNMISVDGLFEGQNKWELDWHKVDAEFQEFAIKQLNSTDILLFGRTTYEGMASYWSSPDAIKDDPIIAKKMNSIPKIVFSKILKKAEWINTKLINNNSAEEISKLKQQIGGDIGIFGSADLASNLINDHLIDEFRIIVSPVILAKGNPLFNKINKRINLQLSKTKIFGNGNVLLYYDIV